YVSTVFTGSSAVTQVFVQRGKDVLLNVTETVVLQKDDDLIWRFNKTSNLVRFIPGGKTTIFTNYKGRAEFFEQNHSVQLKNLQAADSGVYDARVVGDKDRPVAEYTVTVQDPVSEVELNVTQDGGASGSPDSCNVNAICRTADSEISSTFRCVHQTCSQDEGEQSTVTNSGSSLHIYLSDVLIICNHSNQVSRTKATREIQDFCKLDPVIQPLYIYVTVGIVIVLVVLIITGIFVYRRISRTYNTKNIENTVYDTPQVITAQTRDDASPNDASGPSSIYSCAGFPTRSTETEVKPPPESIYSTVQKPARNLQEL
ncbi:uncharacterized protein LOC103374741, partial [Stegastes partitus]|uniref:Uncharacterized protein LOC103374741 n=1 Tax=Stegastes partitus TaxID=144197 RepID=A0A9Y4NT70_9TELE